MIKVLLLVLGGALGTVCRFGVSTCVQRSMLHSFPFGILSVNVLGCFFIGLCWTVAEAFHFSGNTRALLFTGFFGGFTTFSTFALDTITLMKTGEYRIALFNIFFSNLFGLLAVFFGWAVGKNIATFFK